MINILKDLNKYNILVLFNLLVITTNIYSYNTRILVLKKNILKISLSIGILILYINNSELVRDSYREVALY